MTLIDNIISKNILETTLLNELSDISYKATGGVAQSRANSGVINPGKIHFEQPKDEITKEMILDYQKEQQKPFTDIHGNEMSYYPSIYRFDVTDYQHFVPINLGVLGREANETDIEKIDQNIKHDVDNYDITEHNIKMVTNKLNEYNQKILLNDEKLRENANRIKYIDDELKKINPASLTTLQAELASKQAALLTVKRDRKKTQLNKEIEDINYEITKFTKK